MCASELSSLGPFNTANVVSLLYVEECDKNGKNNIKQMKWIENSKYQFSVAYSE